MERLSADQGSWVMLTGCEALHYTACLLWELKDTSDQSSMQGGPYQDGETNGR